MCMMRHERHIRIRRWERVIPDTRERLARIPMANESSTRKGVERDEIKGYLALR